MSDEDYFIRIMKGKMKCPFCQEWLTNEELNFLKIIAEDCGSIHIKYCKYKSECEEKAKTTAHEYIDFAIKLIKDGY